MKITPEKKRLIRLVSLYIGFGFFTLLIVVLSLAPGSVSSEQSGFLVAFINKILIAFGVPQDEGLIAGLSYMIRKLVGHYLLFAADGVFLYFALKHTESRKINPRTLYFPVFVLIALASEGVQLFTEGRAGMIEDVFIDLFGALTPFVLFSLFALKPADSIKSGD